MKIHEPRFSELKSNLELGPVVPNIATLILKNSKQFANKIVFQEKKNGEYVGITWAELMVDIENIASNLHKKGFREGDKMVIMSRNCLAMLELELAVMASGGISVPLYSNFKKHTATLLIEHSDARFAAVEGENQLQQLESSLDLKYVFSFNELDQASYKQNVSQFDDLKKEANSKESYLKPNAEPREICLNMYTSGTMGIPKCVQLTHENILSQQAALSQIWDLDENDSFLSYLPWHHSFGGIFEKFTALYHGATLSIESSYGKNPVEIFNNWQLIKPTLFFSIPKVYENLIQLTKKSQKAEELFFHSGLKFVFTAAAALPKNLSDEFESRGVQVVEGWGLTETSPCCTITDPTIARAQGVVGLPIPGVKIRLDEQGEIQVKGPNVMVEYYKNPEVNKSIFTNDGWFRTGDIGEITATGLKLITRKDRIFKLTNGEKVIPTELEKAIQQSCHYIAYAMVAGSGKDYPVALIFPNHDLFKNSDFKLTPLDGCFCPRDSADLAKCLKGCLNDANCTIGQKFARIKSAVLIDDELSIDNQTLTPSLKMAPQKVEQKYHMEMTNLYGSKINLEEEVYVINLDSETGRVL